MGTRELLAPSYRLLLQDIPVNRQAWISSIGVSLVNSWELSGEVT